MTEMKMNIEKQAVTKLKFASESTKAVGWNDLWITKYEDDEKCRNHYTKREKTQQ